MSPEALPADFLESVREKLAARHVEERRVEDGAPGRIIGPQGRGQPVRFQPGLSDAECMAIESACGCALPSDLKSWLQFVVPLREQEFPDWRGDLAAEFSENHQSILGGFCFDIEHNGFWHPEWQLKPSDPTARRHIAEAALRAAPPLIRLYGHRYIPVTPCLAGNPVFSIVQTDIIEYGNDLADYLAHEFKLPRPEWAATEPREIPFWSEMVRLNT